jgi:hypothetical protein
VQGLWGWEGGTRGEGRRCCLGFKERMGESEEKEEARVCGLIATVNYRNVIDDD